MPKFIEIVTTENKIEIRNLSRFNMKSFEIRKTLLNKYDPKWKLYTFIMGFTMHEKKTPVPPDAGCEILSFVGMLNFYQFINKYQKKNHRIFLIKGYEFPNIFSTKGGSKRIRLF